MKKYLQKMTKSAIIFWCVAEKSKFLHHTRKGYVSIKMIFKKIRDFLKKYWVSIVLLMATVVIIMWLINLLHYSKPTMEFEAKNLYQDTLKVVAQEDFPPYSFVDRDGNLSGYNIELANLIANQLEMNVEIELLPRKECIKALKSGSADILCNANYSDEFQDEFLLTSPTGKHRVIIFGTKDYGTIHELFEMKIAKVIDSPIKSDLHMQMGFTNIVEYNTYEDAFDAVLHGEVDYIIGVYSILDYLTHEMGYTEISAVSTIINTEAFALAVSKDNPDLQEKINISLANINNDGTHEYIANKWLDLYANANINNDVIIDKIPTVIIVYSVFLLCVFYFIIEPIHKKANKDTATKLYNKMTTRKLIKNKLPIRGTMMVMDINDFKPINDTYGHSAGDIIIQNVAEALRVVCREGDIIGRIGGDEFVVYLPKMELESDAINKATQIQSEIKNLTENNPYNIVASVSIGIALHTVVETYDELFNKADKALYCAKKEPNHIAIHIDEQTLSDKIQKI